LSFLAMKIQGPENFEDNAARWNENNKCKNGWHERSWNPIPRLFYTTLSYVFFVITYIHHAFSGVFDMNGGSDYQIEDFQHRWPCGKPNSEPSHKPSIWVW
jgi:hypothetical protein